ncbi:predicted protein [Streptomyces viridochromogenes DSM 40736]|uniref:Predicted protein n=1 Tax=Streptomyces viridochromogenes (strain DSM 40736 / JCM 4977 / BCRC 1201 / Tue 494) TaxID=591159 RepID=D9XI93_STRVT|nr:predicted protein [Streptomyces viridochromogenes DSM 40736]
MAVEPAGSRRSAPRPARPARLTTGTVRGSRSASEKAWEQRTRRRSARTPTAWRAAVPGGARRTLRGVQPRRRPARRRRLRGPPRRLRRRPRPRPPRPSRRAGRRACARPCGRLGAGHVSLTRCRSPSPCGGRCSPVSGKRRARRYSRQPRAGTLPACRDANKSPQPWTLRSTESSPVCAPSTPPCTPGTGWPSSTASTSP